MNVGLVGAGTMGGRMAAKWVEAGFQVDVLLADWHAFINDKFGGDLEKIRTPRITHDPSETARRLAGGREVDTVAEPTGPLRTGAGTVPVEHGQVRPP